MGEHSVAALQLEEGSDKDSDKGRPKGSAKCPNSSLLLCGGEGEHQLRPSGGGIQRPTRVRAGLRRCQARAMSGTILRMSFTELTEAFFMKSAGWEAVKTARALLAGGKVISSNWTPPLLKGVVQEGTSSYRAGLVIKGPVDIDNLCP